MTSEINQIRQILGQGRIQQDSLSKYYSNSIYPVADSPVSSPKPLELYLHCIHDSQTTDFQDTTRMAR